MQRHPNVHTFNFILALKNYEIPLNDMVDALFSIEQEINTETLQIILESYRRAFDSPFNLNGIFKYKTNHSFILPFVEISSLHPEYISFTSIPYTPVDVSVIYPKFESPLPHNWSSLQFIGLLIDLYLYDAERIMKIIHQGIATWPDLLLIGILQQPQIQIIDSVKSILHEIFSYYVRTEKISLEVLKYAWISSNYEGIQLLLMQSMQEYFTQNFNDLNFRVNRILDIAHELGAVSRLLKIPSLAFVVEVSVIARKRGYINLSAFITDKYSQDDGSFIQALFSFVLKHYPLLFSSELAALCSENVRVRENVDILDELIPFVYYHRATLGSENARRAEDLFRNYRIVLDLDSPLRGSHDRDKIEQAAKLVTLVLGYMSGCPDFDTKSPHADDFVKELSQSQNSDSHRSAIFYVLKVISNVKYFAYINDIDLHSISCLASRLFQYDCFDSNKILDLVDNLFQSFPTRSRYFYAGIVILGQTFAALADSPSLCGKWLNSLFFSDLPPFIRFCVEYSHHLGYIPLDQNLKIAFDDPHCSSSQCTPYITDMVARAERRGSELILKAEISALAQYQIPTLEPVIEPSDISLILNSLSSLTEEKVDSFIFIFNSQIKQINYRWFSRYLIREKATLNPCNHLIYKKFLHKFDNFEFYEILREETDIFVRELFSNLNTSSQQQQLDALYSLGYWYGSITIADNKPLRWNEISIKLLIVEAGLKGQDDLFLILPFVRNFLSTIKDNLIFNCHNPWLLSVISALVEIYSRSDLRPILKFDIERLVRSVRCCVKNAPRSIYNSCPEILHHLKTLLPWTTREKDVCLFNIICPKNTTLTYNQFDISSIQKLSEHLSLKSCPQQFERVVTDVLLSVMEELSALVGERVLKQIGNLVETVTFEDFSKSDDKKLIYGAHSFAKSLTLGSIEILVKSSLFDEIILKLRKVMCNSLIDETDRLQIRVEKEQLNEIIFDIIQDNIGIVCLYISKSCAENAILNVDKSLTCEFENRSLNDKIKSSIRLSSVTENIPFKINTNSPSDRQLEVYHSFNKCISGFAQSDNCLVDEEIRTPTNSEKVFLYELPIEQKSLIFTSLHSMCARIFKLAPQYRSDPLLNSVSQLLGSLVSIVNAKNILLLFSVIKQCLTCFFDLVLKQSTIEDCSFQNLIDAVLDTFLILKDNRVLGKHLVIFISNALIDMPFSLLKNINAIRYLAIYNLIDFQKLDSRLISDFTTLRIEIVLDFMLDLTQFLLIDPDNRGILTDNQLSQSLDVLSRVSLHSADVNSVLNNETLPNGDIKNSIDNSNPLALFGRWIKLFYSSLNITNETKFKIFISHSSATVVVYDESSLNYFLSKCLDLIFHIASKQNDNSIYQMLDAFLALLCLILKYYWAPDNIYLPIKINTFSRLLIYLSELIINDLKNSCLISLNFYERLFNKLIIELSRSDVSLKEIKTGCILCILGVLHSLTPELYPHFSRVFFSILSFQTLIDICMNCDLNSKTAIGYNILICDFIKFVVPFTEKSSSPSIDILFSNLTFFIQRLSIEYPDYVSYFTFEFINVIPPHLFHLRNIILSCIPLKGSKNFETHDWPLSEPVFKNYVRYIPLSLLKITENYLNQRHPDILKELFPKFFDNNIRFSYGCTGVLLINSYIYHLGLSVCQLIENCDKVIESAHYEIFEHLLKFSCSSARYVIITAMVNNIRYASLMTKLFVNILLGLYLSVDDNVSEEILSALLERVACSPPYPSGIVYAFSSFIKILSKKSSSRPFTLLKPVQNLMDQVCTNVNLTPISWSNFS